MALEARGNGKVLLCIDTIFEEEKVCTLSLPTQTALKRVLSTYVGKRKIARFSRACVVGKNPCLQKYLMHAALHQLPFK